MNIKKGSVWKYGLFLCEVAGKDLLAKDGIKYVSMEKMGIKKNYLKVYEKLMDLMEK